jgi:hypothetical protein
LPVAFDVCPSIGWLLLADLRKGDRQAVGDILITHLGIVMMHCLTV